MYKYQEYKFSINVYEFRKGGRLVKHEKKAIFGELYTSIENAKIDAIEEMKKMLDIGHSDDFVFTEKNNNGVIEISFHEDYYDVDIVCHTFVGLDKDEVWFGSTDFKRI